MGRILMMTVVVFVVFAHAVHSSDSRYSMNHKFRGRCLIINNFMFDSLLSLPDREGTFVDEEHLTRLFTKLGFEVLTHNDVSVPQLTKIIRTELAEDHSDHDAFVMIFLTHGDEDGLYMIDSQIEVELIVNRFHHKTCPSLAGKPKLFFIQACRGSKYDVGVNYGSFFQRFWPWGHPRKKRALAPPDPIISLAPDFLVSYSGSPGFYAWRNSDHGSWYIQALVKVMRVHWRGTDLLTMLTRVGWLVAYTYESHAKCCGSANRAKMMPQTVSTLNKDVYFTPKRTTQL